MKYSFFLAAELFLFCITLSCKQEIKESVNPFKESWQQQFDEQLQLSGHRNWILVVDKAFPKQPGMQIIHTNQKLLPVLEEVLKKIQQSIHVKPIIYNDAELSYITDSMVKDVSQFKQQFKKIVGNATVQPLLHDSVFVRMDRASRLFSITVLKTEEIIPYSSVFLELDCAYWNGNKEHVLREKIKQLTNK